MTKPCSLVVSLMNMHVGGPGFFFVFFVFFCFFLSPLHIFLSPKGAEIDPLRFKPNPDNMVSKVFHYLSNFCQ